MQFFHFKEIPRASLPTTLLHCPRANNNPSLALPSLDQTQLFQSALSSPDTEVDRRPRLPAHSGNLNVLWQVLPHLCLTDSGVKQ